MGKFRFPLDVVLDYYDHLEDRQRQAVAQTLSLLRDAEKDLEALEAKHEEIRNELAHRQRKGYDGNELSIYLAFLDRLDHELQAQTKRILELQEELHRRKGELVRLHRKRRTLEALREKQLRAFSLDEGRKEQRLLDELHLAKIAGGR